MALIREEYGLREVTVFTPVGLAKIETKEVVASNETIGIEVEVENFQQRDGGVGLNKAWQVANDGSLRNNGMELITRPIPASTAPAMLQYLFGTYLADNCCFSPRTSVHIHLNVQDLSTEQVLNLILMYSVYERLFYKYVGKGRQKNVYCVPLADCDILSSLVDAGILRGGDWSKYTGLNTLPISTYGTTEFRHMHGTTNVGKLSTWINLICKLKDYVKRTSTKEIRSAIAEMNDNFDFGALMHEIFGDYARALQYEGPQELTYQSAKQALTPRTRAREIFSNMKSDSAFFTFKGN